MADHPTPDALEAYVMDALSEADAEALERHVAQCNACASALRREAELEVDLHRVAAHPTPSRRRARPVWPVVAGTCALAAAAAALLWLRLPPEPLDRAAPQLTRGLPPLGICDRRPDYCEHPERHGIVVVGTAGIEAPRYEEGPALLSWRGAPEPNQEERKER